jgi:hypothetical protein
MACPSGWAMNGALEALMLPVRPDSHVSVKVPNVMREDDVSGGDGSGPGTAITIALDVLDTLRLSGLTTIETEPTTAMVAVGVAVSGNSAELVRTMFRAMLAEGGRPLASQQ